jgi:hypothetical protein
VGATSRSISSEPISNLNIAASNANLDLELATEAAPNSNNPPVLRVTAARSRQGLNTKPLTRGRPQMLQITPNTQHPRKWALALRREMQMAVGLQLQVECEPPQELPHELTAILIRSDKEHDLYADIVGTC